MVIGMAPRQGIKEQLDTIIAVHIAIVLPGLGMEIFHAGLRAAHPDVESVRAAGHIGVSLLGNRLDAGMHINLGGLAFNGLEIRHMRRRVPARIVEFAVECGRVLGNRDGRLLECL